MNHAQALIAARLEIAKGTFNRTIINREPETIHTDSVRYAECEHRGVESGRNPAIKGKENEDRLARGFCRVCLDQWLSAKLGTGKGKRQ